MSPAADRSLHCVVGAGTIGRLHYAILRASRRQAIRVDPWPGRGDYPAVDDMPRHVSGRIGIWHICTPTAVHLQTLRKILHVDPAARLLVEKPLCQTDELASVQSLLASHPDARIIVNEQYRYSAPIRWLGAAKRQLSADGGRRIQIHIEMTKNRLLDATAGRFVDNHFGVFGYEWPHLITVLCELLTNDEVEEYLTLSGTLYKSSAENSGWPPLTASEFVRLSTGPSIFLHSSVDGNIGIRDREAFRVYGLGEAPAPPPQLRPGESLRYRFARIAALTGVAKVIFEPRSMLSESGRNLHLCWKSVAGSTAELYVESNHFAQSVTAAVELLAADDKCAQATVARRLGRYMAIARRISATMENWRTPHISCSRALLNFGTEWRRHVARQ
jgi:hypothetical protein